MVVVVFVVVVLVVVVVEVVVVVVVLIFLATFETCLDSLVWTACDATQGVNSDSVGASSTTGNAARVAVMAPKPVAM